MTSYCSASSSPEPAVDPGADAAETGRGGGGEAEWALETLGRMAEGLVHDFNNVLASISGYSELILGISDQEGMPRPEPRRDEVAGFARIILQAVAAGRSTIDDLRQIASNRKRGKESLDLNEVLKQSLSLARGAIGGRIRLKSDFYPGQAGIPGYRGLLYAAFINLILNARDAMPEGGWVYVRTFHQEASLAPFDGSCSAWVVSVRDTGAGMTRELQGRIFEPGYTSKVGPGRGLGLANVRRAVEAHQGMIRVNSAPGDGTEFRIYLPVTDPGTPCAQA